MLAQKQKRRDEINLLPGSSFENTVAGRILAWILSSFRIIVIVTEILVMIAFLSRFVLDAQLSDLNEEIQQKQSIIAASQVFENEFRDTQARLDILAPLLSQQNFPETIRKISNSTPPEVILNKLTITETNIEISGTSPSEKSISQLVTNVNSREGFSSFEIVNINSNPYNPSLLDFDIVGKQL
jgi:Tfp pilus assembly protein PilN